MFVSAVEFNGHQKYLATNTLPKYQYLCSVHYVRKTESHDMTQSDILIWLCTIYHSEIITELFKMIKYDLFINSQIYSFVKDLNIAKEQWKLCKHVAKIKNTYLQLFSSCSRAKPLLSVKQSCVERAALISVRMTVGQSWWTDSCVFKPDSKRN